MSHNPFADPHASQGMDSNPFADPSVQAGVHSHREESHYGLGEDTPTGSKLSLPDSILPPAAAAGPDMSSRLTDLERREQELTQREAQLNAKAEHIRKVSVIAWRAALLFGLPSKPAARREAAALTIHRLLALHLQHGRNNWPPGPWPLIFHDIDQVRPLLPA